MDKKKACHMLADYNERINEIWDSIRSIELKLYTCKENEREWYLNNKEKLKRELEKEEQEREKFISEYGDIIHS